MTFYREECCQCMRSSKSVKQNYFFWGADPESDPVLPSSSKIIKTVFSLLCDFLSLKDDVNVPSKSNKQNNLGKKLFFVGILKVTDEKSRSQSWIRISLSEVRIRGSGSIPKCYGSRTLVTTRITGGLRVGGRIGCKMPIRMMLVTVRLQYVFVSKCSRTVSSEHLSRRWKEKSHWWLMTVVLFYCGNSNRANQNDSAGQGGDFSKRPVTNGWLKWFIMVTLKWHKTSTSVDEAMQN